jgi:DNA invertase Pin-like site-specific DNA recombinase
VGRHRHQHRAIDAGGIRRLGRLERDLIRTRTAEGRSRDKAQGKQMGRPQQKEATRRRAQEATLPELARSYDVSKSTISRLTA